MIEGICGHHRLDDVDSAGESQAGHGVESDYEHEHRFAEHEHEEESELADADGVWRK